MIENKWHKKEEPFLSMSGLGGGSFQQAFLPAPTPKVYVDDIFSTFVWDGEDSATAINNGIDLSGEGGLVWIKNRLQTYNHWWFDTERGVNKVLTSSQVNGEATESKGVTAFNSNGFTVGGSGGDCGFNCGSSNQDYVYWTFRKKPGFFDVVKYTGNGGTQNISHSLGTTPHMVIIKKYNSAGDWAVAYMQGVSLYTGDAYTGMYLNKTDARGGSTANGLGVSAVGDSTFTVINSGSNTLEFFPNSSGDSYVAYLFAESASFGTTGSEKISEVGTYTGTGATNPALSVNVGFEPQWLMIKRIDSSGPWIMVDAMRGVIDGGTDKILQAESNQIESNLEYNAIKFTSTGFTLETTQGDLNGNGGSYSYLAIRRPHKPPEAATEVFTPVLASSSGDYTATAGFPVDLNFYAQRSGNDKWFWRTRLTGNGYFQSQDSDGIDGSGNTYWDSMTAFKVPGVSGDYSDYINYNFKRAPGFFDIVTYSGTGSNITISHNLAAVPELMIVKSIGSDGWKVYHKDLGNAKYLFLHTNDAESTGSTIWNNTSPTSTQFTVGTDSSSSGARYVSLLFASLNGISKVGTYSGSNSAVDVDCGFTNGARFVLIKRTDASADWFVVDTIRGITSGNDPYLSLNTRDAEGTTVNVINSTSSGFQVQTNGGAAINTSGGTYLFLAIA